MLCFSYFSEVSAGGTRTKKKKKKIRDKDGKVVGYGSAEAYSSSGKITCASNTASGL